MGERETWREEQRRESAEARAESRDHYRDLISGQGIGRDEFHEGLTSLRAEFGAGLSTAGVQIGAVEKTLVQKIDSGLHSLRLWGALALVSGQVAAGMVSAFIGTGKTAGAVSAAARSALGFIVQH